MYVRSLMRLTTILNRVHKIPDFVFGQIRLLENAPGDGRWEVQVRPRAGNRPVCSVCGMPGPERNVELHITRGSKLAPAQ